MEGYIKIYRKMIEWEWYRDTNTFVVFLHCLLSANYKEGRFVGHTIPAGSFVTSIGKISQDLNISSHQVRTALEHLINTEELTTETTNKFTIINVANWAKYQGEDTDDGKQSDNQVANKRQTSGKQVATIEESKKERSKEGKKRTKEYIVIDEIEKFANGDENLKKAIIDFIDMRQKIKKPMTDNAIILLLGKLAKLKESGQDTVACLNQSIFASWQGVFEVKADFIQSQTAKSAKPSKYEGRS